MKTKNPGGSIKDRIGRSMIEDAEASGALKPGGTIIEATAGNTGLGLALVAGQKGYKLILVVPDKMAQEKVFHLRAMGVQVMITRSDVGKGHPDYYQDIAQRLADEHGYLFINQFGNDANPRAHYTTTGPEILAQCEAFGVTPDAVVLRRRLRGHDHRPGAIFLRALSVDGNGAGRPGRFDRGALH